VKESLVHENEIHKLWLSFQPSTKVYMVGTISWKKLLHLLDVVVLKTITVEYLHPWKFSTHLHVGFAEQH
jgi:hypothetical protein